MRMRTLPQCVAYLKESDPDNALTACALRRLVRSGELPSVRVGTKYLVALETLDSFCETPQKPSARIRTVT